MAVPRLIWLAQPTRFATLSRGRARLALVALLLLLAAAVAVALAPSVTPASDPDSAAADPALLYQGMVDGMRHGGSYYVAAADELREGGYAMPASAIRLPTLAVVQAALPSWGVVVVLCLLAVGVVIAWFLRLRRAFARRAPLLLAMVLLAGGMAAVGPSAFVAVPELWAGLLIALSLAMRRPGRWVAAAGIGALAMLIRESAALYVVVMATLAWVEGERREAWGWAAGLPLLAVALVAHAQAVAAVVGPLDPVAATQSGMPGFGGFVDAVTAATVLRLAPVGVGAGLIALALFGWAGWRDATSPRALATFTGYAVSIALFGSVGTLYWGLMVAPLILVGLAFAPDAMRDAIAAAFPRRRVITVTRLT